MLKRRKSTPPAPGPHDLERRLFIVDPYEGSAVARQLGDALRRGDRTAVRAIVAAGVAWTDLVTAVNAIAADDIARQMLEMWWGDEPDDLFVLTLEAAVLAAWAVRRRLANNRSGDSKVESQAVEDLFLLAEERLVLAASRAPSVPLPWAFLVRTGVALTIPHAEVVMRWERARRDLDVLWVRASYLSSFDVRSERPTPDDYVALADEISRGLPLGDPRHATITLVVRRLGLRLQKETEAYSSNHEAIRSAAAQSVLNPAFDPTVADGLAAVNLFAHAFIRMGDLDLADQLLARVNWHLSPEPWNFVRPNPIDAIRLVAASSK